MPDKSKACSKCGEVKPLDAFTKQKNCRGGYRPDCKRCKADAALVHRNADLAAHRERDRLRYQNNPERRAKQIATARAAYLADAEAARAYRRAYYEANPGVYEKARAKRNALLKNVEHQPYTRREIYERDGGTCRGCAKTLPNEKGAFQIDHIVPISLGGPDTPANVQLMCPKCNRAKWATLDGQIHMPV